MSSTYELSASVFDIEKLLQIVCRRGCKENTNQVIDVEGGAALAFVFAPVPQSS